MIAFVDDRRLDVIDDLARRRFIGGGLSLAALVAACGTESTPASSTGAPAADSGFPVTLVGKEGTATVPAEPHRVIALGFQRDTDTALALGVAPVAITENSIFPNLVAPWVESELTDPRPELLNATSGIPFEKVAGLRPDLILATDDYELANNYPRLAQIAPTLSHGRSKIACGLGAIGPTLLRLCS